MQVDITLKKFSSNPVNKLQTDDLPALAKDVRELIVDVVSQNGNSHFNASLGVVERVLQYCDLWRPL